MLAGASKHCDKSCLGELQMQMLIVFTGKTFGLQLVELAKPFVQKKAQHVLALCNLNNLAKSTKAATLSIVKAPVKLVAGAIDAMVMVVHPGEQEEECVSLHLYVGLNERARCQPIDTPNHRGHLRRLLTRDLACAVCCHPLAATMIKPPSRMQWRLSACKIYTTDRRTWTWTNWPLLA